MASLDAQLEALKNEYEQKLSNDAAAVLAASKARVHQLRAEASDKAVAQANKIKSDASAKIKSCADFVYDFIVKEFAQ